MLILANVFCNMPLSTSANFQCVVQFCIRLRLFSLTFLYIVESIFTNFRHFCNSAFAVCLYSLTFLQYAVEHIRKFFRAKKKPQTCCGFVYFQRSFRALQITVPFQASVAPLAVAFLLCWFHLSHCLRGSVLPCTPQNLQATKLPILSQIRRV